MSTRKSGKYYEGQVCEQLKKLNYRLLITNFQSYFGEIDIIAIESNTLVFIEVKARTSLSYGQPYEAVTTKKLNKIIKTGQFFRNQYKTKKLPAATRIDIASVLINQKGHSIQDFQLLKNVTR